MILNLNSNLDLLEEKEFTRKYQTESFHAWESNNQFPTIEVEDMETPEYIAIELEKISYEEQIEELVNEKI